MSDKMKDALFRMNAAAWTLEQAQDEYRKRATELSNIFHKGLGTEKQMAEAVELLEDAGLDGGTDE